VDEDWSGPDEGWVRDKNWGSSDNWSSVDDLEEYNNKYWMSNLFRMVSKVQCLIGG
jgi:hypothetical protein